MEANTISTTANNHSQAHDTIYGATVNSDVTSARSKFATEAIQSMDKTCPGMPGKPHDADAVLVGSGSYTVPDRPGVKCSGGFIEIQPIWNKDQVAAGKPDGAINSHSKPDGTPIPGAGSEGNGTEPRPENTEHFDFSIARPMPLGHLEPGKPQQQPFDFHMAKPMPLGHLEPGKPQNCKTPIVHDNQTDGKEQKDDDRRTPPKDDHRRPYRPF